MGPILQTAAPNRLPFVPIAWRALAEAGGADHPLVGFGEEGGCALIAAMTSPTTAALPSGAPAFRRVALIGRHASADLAQPLSRLAAFLVSGGHDVVIEEETARSTPLSGYPSVPPGRAGENADVAIVVGGDGGDARDRAPPRAARRPLIGINQGRLGFLTDIPIARMEATLARLKLCRNTEASPRSLAPTVRTKRRSRSTTSCSNRGGGGTMIDCAVETTAGSSRDARRRDHRRHADRIDRVRALGGRADPRSARTGVCAGTRRTPRADASADRGPGHRGHRDQPRARTRRCAALRRPGALRALRRRTHHGASGSARGAVPAPRGARLHAMLRENCTEETPERRAESSWFMLRLPSIRNFVASGARAGSGAASRC
jgi:hypothetical protein